MSLSSGRSNTAITSSICQRHFSYYIPPFCTVDKQYHTTPSSPPSYPTTTAKRMQLTHPPAHLPFTSALAASPESPPVPQQPLQETCSFKPHTPLRTTQSAFSIPQSAWPLLQTLLNTHIIPQIATPSPPTSSSSDPSPPSPPIQQQQQRPLHDSVQTLPLRSFSDDASLEGLVLGLVFSTGEEKDASYKELRSLSPPKDAEAEKRSCIEDAVRKVEEGRVMEGVLELDGRGGTVGFLVYRVD